MEKTKHNTQTRFNSSDEVFEWLSNFINLEQGQKPKSFLLERMIILAELAGNPHKCAPSIHIAGSKGKGSVTSMLAAMLTANGMRTARYMSPHVIDIRERLCLDGSYFDESIYIDAGNELRAVTEEKLPALVKSQSGTAQFFDPSAPGGCEPTFWELLTLLFFLCARLSKCDVMVTETGMGGRLDSTNILDPLVSVITLIELEHTGILGNTIAAIAGEKAGIIKPGKPLVLAKQSEEALEVFKTKSRELNSSMFYFPETTELSNINISERGTKFDLSSSEPLLRSPCKIFDLSIPLPGKVQAENAALAIAAIKTAFPEIGEDSIRKGLANLNIPARFEKIAEQPLFIIDGAHTPESFALCAQTFCSLYGEGGILIFGCAADKDAEAMARIAAQVSHSNPRCARFSKVIITTPGTFKASSPQRVYESFAKIAGNDKVELIKDTAEAIKQAIKLAKEERKYLPILAAGSFYLVSEIRRLLVTTP